MTWVDIKERQPELKDESVLVHFETGSIETVHIEDWFRAIGNGADAEGNVIWTQWYLIAKPTITHWMPLPEPPNKD